MTIPIIKSNNHETPDAALSKRVSTRALIGQKYTIPIHNAKQSPCITSTSLSANEPLRIHNTGRPASAMQAGFSGARIHQMDTSAIIKELRSIEADAQAYAAGMELLRERSYSLRKKLEGIVSPASPREQRRKEKVAAESSVRFAKKMARKTLK